MERSLLRNLNSVGQMQPECLSLDDLDVGGKYVVAALKMIKTCYGKKVLVSLENKGSVFLPDRFTTMMTAEYVSVIKKCYLTYKGKVDSRLIYKGKDIGKGHPKHIIEFDTL